ncbi:MAG TPA: hypothetical protein VEZ44_07960 [bacterium]|nr:hypothetical protein [bacterium]
MNTRWWIAIGMVGAVGLLAVPVLAQPGIGCGPGFGAGYGGPAATGQPLSLTQAETIARQAVAQSGNAGLAVSHIMEFSNNFYVAVKDKATGQGAFELLINRYAGFVHPEPQSMMWNTRYGRMTGFRGPGGFGAGMRGRGVGPGMMGPGFGPGAGFGPGTTGPGFRSTAPARTSPLTLAQATAQAQQYLDAQQPGAKTGEAIAFPGYYTIDVDRNGRPIGMLSVNADTGEVWYHIWHGTFLQEKDLN